MVTKAGEVQTSGPPRMAVDPQAEGETGRFARLRISVVPIGTETLIDIQSFGETLGSSEGMGPSVAAPHPDPLDAIERELTYSYRLLDLPDDWDDEGSPGYGESTLLRAHTLIRGAVQRFVMQTGVDVPVPHIGAGPNGSIDLYWKRDGRQLLVTVPPAPEDLIGYYGQTPRGATIKGRIDPSANNEWLLAWFTQ